MRTRLIALFTALVLGGTLGVVTAPTSSAGVSGVKFGALVKPRSGETFAQAVARADATYGTPTPMPISRIFYTGAPQAWPGNHGLSGRPVVVSFRYRPSSVLTGQYDAALRSWFANAPSYDVYWSYSHEPEDNITRGEFTAADYRAAWQHISDIADEAAPETAQLHSTLILMCYTMNPASNRNWLNYYVPTAQSMLAFDCYNHAWRRNAYGTPANMFKPITNWSAANPTIPWGVSEVGSVKVSSDPTGTGRAAWLRSVGTWLANKHAENPGINAIFGIYFDVTGPKGTDYRLLDAPSQEAWREVVQDY